MALTVKTGAPPLNLIIGLVLACALLAAGWSVRSARNAPDPAIAPRLLDLAFVSGREVFAKGDGGKVAVAKLDRGEIATIKTFACYEAEDPFAKTYASRKHVQPPPYDCVYRLTGTDGAPYIAVVRLNHMPVADLREIGRFVVGYVSMDDARKVLQRAGIALP